MTYAQHDERLLHSPEECAALLGVGRTNIFDLIARGELESFKIGHLRKIPREALADYIKRQRDQASQPGA